ncbi:S41 family peptidase [Pirellulimonas nuda]|uniref:S41 family peptidase n=1 Tax=Pirellulimonas nuda TaxID=2528009 RepID=UPI0018D274A2|nr:S41 family peptidase [Pirellulimonas nuda]
MLSPALLCWCICSGLLLAPSAQAQQPNPTEPAEIAKTLSAGLALEQQGSWSEALGQYEEALRQFPDSAELQQRFDIARVHHSLDRRYTDPSFLAAVRSFGEREARDLLSDLLRKIDSHYVTSPPWSQLVQRGGYGVDVALRSEAFRTSNGVRASGEQIVSAGQEMRAAISRRGAISSRQQMLEAAEEAARIGEFRLGLSKAATLLEFAATSAEGLDHYSSFLTPDQLRDVYSQIEGNFVGLGVELKADNGDLLVVRTIPGSPAERAGIYAGDRIVAVDGRVTSELSTDEAAALLTGVEGSTCRVSVVPAGSDLAPSLADTQPQGGSTVGYRGPPSAARQGAHIVAVRREHVEVPSLEDVSIIDKTQGVAYLRLPVFQKTTSRDFDTALWDLHRQGMQSLVVDLRGNPGGLLTAAVELADKFVAQGGIVSTRGRSPGEDFDYRANRGGTWRVPLVVLIDGDSASASEIFAAAIRDNHRGAIVGQRSFGKGSVQGIFPLGIGGAGIRLTTAKFYSPLGKPINGVGVSPDPGLLVSPADNQKTVVAYRGPSKPDPQLDAALAQAIEAAVRQVAMR